MPNQYTPNLLRDSSRACPHCRDPFVPKYTRQRYCSQRCVNEARRALPLADHLWSKLDRSGGPDACWPFTGKPNNDDGYGRIMHNGKRYQTHRLAWELTNGPIPDGMEACHNCPGGDNPACGNPAHLFLGTRQENATDMVRKGRSLKGDRSPARLHPERLARGARTRPETRARGERHAWHVHPELVKRGESHYKARLTEEQVRAIRAEHEAGTPQRALAKAYGVGKTTIGHIVSGRTWQHVANS